MVVNGAALSIGPIAIRKLRAGEAAMMPTMIESRVGVSNSEEAQALLPEAHRVAALFISDRSRGARSAGRSRVRCKQRCCGDRRGRPRCRHRSEKYQRSHSEGLRARSPGRDRRTAEGILEGRAAVSSSRRMASQRTTIRSRSCSSTSATATQGELPTKNAIAGLEWAMELAPFDSSLRWLPYEQLIADERYGDAALRTLAPLAYSPHPGEHTAKARQLLKDIEAKLEPGQAASPDAVKAE